MQPKATTPLYTPRMRRLKPGRWLVESSTRPGIGYPCTVDACGCTAGRYGRMCRHRKLVIRAEAWLAGNAAPAPASAAIAVPEPAPVPPTPQGVPDFHQSAGYLALSAAFE